jgi:hypothetical protein
MAINFNGMKTHNHHTTAAALAALKKLFRLSNNRRQIYLTATYKF